MNTKQSSSDLEKIFSSPFLVIKNAIRYGGGAILKLVVLFVFILILNLFAFGFHFWKMLPEGLHLGEWIRIFAALFVSIGTIGFISLKMYQTFKGIVFKSVYDQVEPFVLKFSQQFLSVIKKAPKNNALKGKGRLLDESLNNAPLFFRIGMRVMMHFIPIVKVMDSGRKALLVNDEMEAARLFHEDFNQYLEEAYMEMLELKWAMWAIGINILIYVALFIFWFLTL
jgi:hypothetical protein